jgi:hypothetical protein
VLTNAFSLAPDAMNWLVKTRQPRILHVFDRACNLINERREVLSIVTPEIGDGPFNLVVQDDVCFSGHLSLESKVTIISPTQLHLRDLTIYTSNANIWSPHPDWVRLHDHRDTIANQLMKLSVTNDQVPGLNTGFVITRPYSTTFINPKLPITNYGPSNSLVSSLPSAFANVDISSAKEITSKLAGLGSGLTPAGDDFIVGAIYAAWIIHPLEVASVLTQATADIAAPLTTSLSAAWLKSAGQGEVGILWHQFFDALISAGRIANPAYLQEAIGNILSVGETSGADALAGFFGTMMAWAALPHPKTP